MRTIAAILFLPFLLSGCNEEENSSTKREFFKQTDLEFMNHGNSEEDIKVPTIESGENLVFRYTLVHPEEKNIADDELTEYFYFEIPSDEDSFHFSSTDIPSNESIPAAYQRVCFCFFGNFNIKSANISAEKKSDKQWKVSFEATFKTEHEEILIQDTGVYTLSSL